VDDAPQSQQFWRNENGKPKKRNGQINLSDIEIRVYPSADKKRSGEKFTDLFPIDAHNPTFSIELWNGVNDIKRKRFSHASYGSQPNASDPAHHSKSTSLFDHLVGAGEQRGRDFDAERFCCFDIYRQFELGRPYNR
jgi:hypothetical protein